MNEHEKEGGDPMELVLTAMRGLNGDPAAVAKHIKETPIRVLGGRTIEQALSDGDVEKVMR